MDFLSILLPQLALVLRVELDQLGEGGELLAPVQVVEVPGVLDLDVGHLPAPSHGEGEVPGVSFAWPREEASVTASLKEEVLRLDSMDVGVEPTTARHYSHFWIKSPLLLSTSLDLLSSHGQIFGQHFGLASVFALLLNRSGQRGTDLTSSKVRGTLSLSSQRYRGRFVLFSLSFQLVKDICGG